MGADTSTRFLLESLLRRGGSPPPEFLAAPGAAVPAFLLGDNAEVGPSYPAPSAVVVASPLSPLGNSAVAGDRYPMMPLPPGRSFGGLAPLDEMQAGFGEEKARAGAAEAPKLSFGLDANGLYKFSNVTPDDVNLIKRAVPFYLEALQGYSEQIGKTEARRAQVQKNPILNMLANLSGAFAQTPSAPAWVQAAGRASMMMNPTERELDQELLQLHAKRAGIAGEVAGIGFQKEQMAERSRLAREAMDEKARLAKEKLDQELKIAKERVARNKANAMLRAIRSGGAIKEEEIDKFIDSLPDEFQYIGEELHLANASKLAEQAFKKTTQDARLAATFAIAKMTDSRVKRYQSELITNQRLALASAMQGRTDDVALRLAGMERAKQSRSAALQVEIAQLQAQIGSAGLDKAEVDKISARLETLLQQEANAESEYNNLVEGVVAELEKRGVKMGQHRSGGGSPPPPPAGGATKPKWQQDLDAKMGG